MEQRSPEWYAARCGKVTASRVADIIARTRSGWSTSRGNYLAELVCERETGQPYNSGFNSAAMQWGTDTEEDAVRWYEQVRDMQTEEVGFVPHPRIAMAGASPDRKVRCRTVAHDHGLLEVKCPNTKTHLDMILSRSIPAKYITQMQWQMACTGDKWCDFVSYDPRCIERRRLFLKRVMRDELEIRRLEAEVIAFLAEVDAYIEELDRDGYSSELKVRLEASIALEG